MAKKDKKKAIDNSWEEEIDATPAEAVKPLSKEEEPGDKPPLQISSADDDFMNGGLLGAIRKNAGKKKGKANEYGEGEREKVHGDQP